MLDILGLASLEAPWPVPFAGALGLGFGCAGCLVARWLDWRLLSVVDAMVSAPCFSRDILPIKGFLLWVCKASRVLLLSSVVLLGIAVSVICSDPDGEGLSSVSTYSQALHRSGG